MSFALNIPVTESLKELRTRLKASSPMMAPRIKMLIEMKKQEIKEFQKGSWCLVWVPVVKVSTTGVRLIKTEEWRRFFITAGKGKWENHLYLP